jgi:hypothetical protein
MSLQEPTWIVEGLMTTVDAAGVVNLAPMGPRVNARWERLLLRPFTTAQTFANLRATGHGVFHVIDDVHLLAQAAIGPVRPMPALRSTRRGGAVLVDCCRWYEVEVETIVASGPRAEIMARVVASARVRDCLGLNRAAFAVVEAAIQATRVHLLPRAEIEADFDRWRTLVEKTGSAREQSALDLLQTYLEQTWAGGRP